MNLIEWLYDPTPITADWLREIWKGHDGLALDFVDGPHVKMLTDDAWLVQQSNQRKGGMVVADTRGEFRRAAELLGIATKEVRPEDEGDSHESLGFLQQFDWWEVHRSNSGDTHRINMSVRLASGKYVKVYGRVGESPIAAVRRLKSKIAGEQTKGGE